MWRMLVVLSSFGRGGAVVPAAVNCSSGRIMPIVDPDPAGIGTYLVSAVLLALGIAIFLYILIGEARANRERSARRWLAGAEPAGRDHPAAPVQ